MSPGSRQPGLPVLGVRGDSARVGDKGCSTLGSNQRVRAWRSPAGLRRKVKLWAIERVMSVLRDLEHT